jgi:hypothetical protein
MTWTQIDPDRFSQYEDMTPAQIGRSLLTSRPHTLDMLREQQNILAYTEALMGRAWEYKVNDDWHTFWKSVYDLRDKPQSDWDEDDYFSYRAMIALLPASAVRDV